MGGGVVSSCGRLGFGRLPVWKSSGVFGSDWVVVVAVVACYQGKSGGWRGGKVANCCPLVRLPAVIVFCVPRQPSMTLVVVRRRHSLFLTASCPADVVALLDGGVAAAHGAHPANLR